MPSPEVFHNNLLSNPAGLIARISQALHARAAQSPLYGAAASDLAATSAVVLLLGRCGPEDPHPGDACLILNKRSARVRQAGDLCCPGGSVSPRFDVWASRVLGLPGGPLARWPYWRSWRRRRPLEARWLALYCATALREAFEEMRLNPFRVRLLGPLPHQRLALFSRLIYPLAAWVPHQQRFKPNWEVERIVHVPLRSLLTPANYICYQLSGVRSAGSAGPQPVRELPAFQWPSAHGAELLWGATFRIAMDFLKVAFGFRPPERDDLPRVIGQLGEGYLSGARDV
jgi:8-oxo-dGTP pyrophosphatase MutT (NUDIX family)